MESYWLFQKFYFGSLKDVKRGRNPAQLQKKELKTDEDLNHLTLDS